MPKKDEVFQTLQRFNSLIKSSPLIKMLSHLVDINFAVVGGAVRDFVLDKPIKDIDITVEFNFYHNLNVDYSHCKNSTDDIFSEQCARAEALEVRNYSISKIFEKEEFASVRKKENYSHGKFNAASSLVRLVEYVIETSLDYVIENRFENKKDGLTTEEIDIKDSAYSSLGLFAVLGVSDKKSLYPIELLFTQDSTSSFVQIFDFNICKIYMLDTDGKPDIVETDLFQKDKKNMTITYQPVADINEVQMNKSLLIRYDRLYDKFPEYELVTDVGHVQEQMKETIKNTVNTVNIYHKMKNLLKSHTTKKVNKI